MDIEEPLSPKVGRYIEVVEVKNHDGIRGWSRRLERFGRTTRIDVVEEGGRLVR